MIEKKINYVWFGGDKPKEILLYIENWKKKMPDYEIIEWNEKTFDLDKEIEKNAYLKECYKRKLWAFMEDYVRVKVLYEYGGIYLDTDVEVVKSFDELLDADVFLGYETKGVVNCAVAGAKSKTIFFKKILDFYENDIWKSNKYIITDIFTEIIKNNNFIENIKIYPEEYFYPYNYNEVFSRECIRENTYAIHHWEKSWKENTKVYYLKYKHLPYTRAKIKYFFKQFSIFFKNLRKNKF